MSESDFQRLVTALQQDSSLRGELRTRAHDLAAVMNRAHEKGYSITRDEAAKLVAGLDELSDDELEQAAGGDDPWSPKP